MVPYQLVELIGMLSEQIYYELHPAKPLLRTSKNKEGNQKTWAKNKTKCKNLLACVVPDWRLDEIE